MGLLISYTDDSDRSYTDAYISLHNIDFNITDTTAFISMFAYKSKAARAAGKKSLHKPNPESVNLDTTDHDLFFTNAILNTNKLNYRTQGYKYLKTVDPDAEGSKHSAFIWDLKNDAIHSLTTNQRDQPHWVWVTNDFIFNETTDTREQYNGVTWDAI